VNSPRHFSFYTLGVPVVLHHPWYVTGEDPPNREDAGNHPSPRRGGRGAHSTSNDYVLHRGVGARVLAQ
jgi:hypothetical protein